MLGKGSFVPTSSHAASLPFFSLHRFFVCICTHTTLKPGSRNSLGQPFHPSLSQFLVKHLLLLLQKGKIFPLAQVMRPLIHTPWFRQPFTSGLLNTYISHLQNSGDTLSCASSSPVTPPPAQIPHPCPQEQWVIPHHLPHSTSNATCNTCITCSSHKGFYRGFSLPSWADPPHYPYSLIFLPMASFTAAPTAN